ncbi:MAG: endopeptidase La [Bacillota bacterium]
MNSYLAIKTSVVATPKSMKIIPLESHEDLLMFNFDTMIGQDIVLMYGNSDAKLSDLIKNIGVVGTIEQVLTNPFDEKTTLGVDIKDYVMLENCTEDVAIIASSEVSPYIHEVKDAERIDVLLRQAEVAYKDYLDAIGSDESLFDKDNIIASIDAIMDGTEETQTPFSTLFSIDDRLTAFIADIIKATALVDLEKSVETAVANAAAENHREFYAREKIKALTEELDGENEVEDYLTKIDELEADKAVKTKLTKEARRINKTAPSSPDMAILKNYLDSLLELPWKKCTKDNDDLSRAEDILNEDHYGLEKVKERLLEALAVRKLSTTGRSPIICLVGPPGTGKTSIAESIARAMDKKFVRLSLGGIKDEADIRGHRKTYVGAMAGRIIDSVKQAGSANPVFLMDEIDKMASSYRGDPASALLEVLDPAQNVSFRDHYVELPFDLSQVLFITTANYINDIAEPLLDRMEVIELSGYTTPEKMEIAKRYLVPKAYKNNGIAEEWLSIEDSAISTIIEKYTRESGVRGLEKSINSLARKIARKNVDKDAHELTIVNNDNLIEFLGEEKVNYALVEENDEVGVVNGLAWTQSGGATLQIEVSLMKGKGVVNLTGSLGDVMKESANIAVSYCRTHAKELGINEDFYANQDIHIHVPEGGTPKDGPSAGVTITTALVSALTGKPVDRLVAMTGEVTLRGKVLPIGGLKEKCLAAVRAGVKKVFVPKENKRDYNELPDIVKESLEFIFVDNVKSVLNGAIK